MRRGGAFRLRTAWNVVSRMGIRSVETCTLNSTYSDVAVDSAEISRMYS